MRISPNCEAVESTNGCRMTNGLRDLSSLIKQHSLSGVEAVAQLFRE